MSHCTVQAVCIFYQLMSADGGMKNFMEFLEGGDLHPYYKKLVRVGSRGVVPAHAIPRARRAIDSSYPHDVCAGAGVLL